MKSAYIHSNFEQYAPSDLDKDEDEIPTPRDVKRELCPVCSTDEFVRPYIAGLIKPDEQLWEDIAEGRISVSFGCEVNRFWSWDCKKCHAWFGETVYGE